MPVTELIRTKCDNPDCGVCLEYSPKETGEDMANLPDGMFRFLILAGFISGKWTFCSKYCLLQWLKSYVTPKSPRELIEEQKAKDVEAERLTKLAEAGMKEE